MGSQSSMLSQSTTIRLGLLLLASLALVARAAPSAHLDQQWEQFKTRYAKAYTRALENRRRMAWEANYQFMQEHNAAYEKGEKTYQVGENEYNDLTNSEFVSMMSGLHYSETSNGQQNNVFNPILEKLPEKVDWRPKGFVTPVKNQKMCGSCWAFSATGSLEGATFNKTKKPVSLSEQNLVDCSMKEGNHGCMGGLMDFAFKYIQENKGIDTEESYPYTAKTGKTCLFNSSTIGATVTGWKDIKSGSEMDLESAVAQVGPISVGIDAGHPGFQMYKQGVYYSLLCSNKRLDHGVLAVGYGEQEFQGMKQKYWLVKNSWGETWGDQGYIKMAKDLGNMCGIATQASFPTV